VPEHTPGLELSRRLYLDGVAPLLAARFPTLRHSAALIGTGSEVLGYDTTRSTDHNWGPRLQLFLSREDSQRLGRGIATTLSDRLPKNILGYPTHLITDDDGITRHMRATDGPVHHAIEITDLGTWFSTNLGFDARGGITTSDWLSTTTQTLAGVTAGAVFHDDLGGLSTARDALEWYPLDIWRYVLACQWQRIAEEEAFVGRCGEVGDELGSAVVAARLVRDVMRLRLLQQRRYPPYSKWLGSAFSGLPDAPHLGPQLAQALSALRSSEREATLASVYEHVARAQNQLALAPCVDPATRPYHGRPFRVLHAERFAQALQASIADPAIRELPLVGAVDQWIDNTTALGRREALRRAHAVMTQYS
jgi:hypothetical protein